jgi:hypothetical protein
MYALFGIDECEKCGQEHLLAWRAENGGAGSQLVYPCPGHGPVFVQVPVTGRPFEEASRIPPGAIEARVSKKRFE